MSEIKKVELAVPTGAELMGPAEAAYRDAVEVIIDCDEMRDVAVEEQRKTITKPLLEAKAAVDALFKPALDRLDSARQVLDKAVLTYTADQERKAREEQARIEAAAAAERKRAEEAAAAAAENARKLAEQAAQAASAEEAAKLAEQAAQAASAEEAAKLAEQAERAQQEAAAQAVVAETIVAPVAVIETKISGASVRGTIDFEVTDITKLIAYVAANMDRAPNLASLLTVDSVKLRAFVKTYGPDTAGKEQLPGVRIFEKKSLAASKRAA